MDWIIYEDNDIIVVNKPVGVPSQSDRTGDMDMVSRLKNYLFAKNPQKGEPYVGIIHRLDRPVGGIMVFAKTKKAAATLSKAVQEHKLKKQYLAVVTKAFPEKVGSEEELLTDYLLKDAKTNTSKVVTPKTPNSKKAQLYYEVQKSDEEKSLVKVRLLTGRHHQIRVQLAKHLAPIWGDTKYNPEFSQRSGWSQIALFAYQLTFPHPITGKEQHYEILPTNEPFADFI